MMPWYNYPKEAYFSPVHFLHFHCILTFVHCLVKETCCKNLQIVLYVPLKKTTHILFNLFLSIDLFFRKRACSRFVCVYYFMIEDNVCVYYFMIEDNVCVITR